jgi:hypothetical protein
MKLQNSPSAPAVASPSLLAARRFIRDRRVGDHSTLYRVYIAVICGAFLGVPGIFSAIGAVSLLSQAVGPVAVAESLHAAGAVFVALTAFMPSHAGLVVPTAPELFYFIEGPFGVRKTLTHRTMMLFMLAATAGGLAAGVAAAGLGLDGWTAARAVASGLGLGGIAAGSLVVRQSAFATTGRWVIGGVGLLLCAASPWFGGTGWLPLAVSALEFAAAVVLFALVPACLDSVPLGRLEEDMASRDALLAGLMAGDARAIGSTRNGRTPRFRRLRTGFPAGPWSRALRVDFLSVLRTPIRSGTALLAGAAAGALTCAADGNLLAVAVALVVLEQVFRVLAKGLLDYLDTVGADRIVPDPFCRTVLRHMMMPWTLLVLCIGAGALAAFPLVQTGAQALAVLALMLTAPPCVSLMLSGSAGVPVGMMSPVLSPVGDASSLALVLWMFRALIPAGLFVLIAFRVGIAVGVAVLIPASAALAVLRLRSLRGVEAKTAGHPWPGNGQE